MEERKAAKAAVKTNKWKEGILWLPLLMIVGIVPNIIRMYKVYLSQETAEVLHQTEMIEFYAYGKATLLYILTISMLVILFLTIDKSRLKKDAYIKIFVIGAALFGVITLLSTLLSPHKSVAWDGMPDRAEGFWVNLTYIIITLYTLYVFNQTKQYQYIVGALGVVLVVNTVYGICQYMGHDPVVELDFLKKLIIPKELLEQYGDISNEYGAKYMSGTLFQHDYMGSFSAMMVPFLFVLTLATKEIKGKIGIGILTVCSVILLIGCNARSGLVGVACAIIIGFIIFARKLIKKKWQVAVGIISCVVLLVGANFATHNSLFRRVPSLIQDIGQIFSNKNAEDIYANVPVKNIENINHEVVLTLAEHQVIIGEAQGEVYFKDETGNNIHFNYHEDTETGSKLYTFDDASYGFMSFEKLVPLLYKEDGTAVNGLHMLANGQNTLLLFRIDAGEGVTLCDSFTGKPMDVEFADAIGFKGKEKLGSARGYIWSRSLPLVMKHLLVGTGPDTFALEFPHRDYIALWAAYGTPNMVVDKAHNLYLQYAINNGGLALLGFLMMIGAYIVQSLKLYALKRDYPVSHLVGVATFLGITGYLVTGLFNDSIICVAPIFWVLLGMGMAVNYLVSHETE